ncbi:MAG: hypothetical protein AABY15_03930 [Nanoarchaeota archaeon]
MFSKRIISSSRFLMMSPSAQALYFHLGMYTDDEGIVEAYHVLKMTDAKEDDFKLLIAKNFIKLLNEELITYIVDWNENNLIRSDRKIPSIYHNLLVKVLTEKELLVPIDNQATTKRQPNDALSKVKLSKVKLSKEYVTSPPAKTRKEKTFNKDDYTRILTEYQRLKGITLQGKEYDPVMQVIKTMFMSDRSPDDIVACMEWFAAGGEEWMGNWTIRTVKMKLPEFMGKKHLPTSKKY